MKNLTKALGIAGITALSFLPMKDAKGQTYKSDNYNKKESEKRLENFRKGMELINCEDLAIAYLDSSADPLNGSPSKEQLIQKVNLSLEYLSKSKMELDLFIKKYRNYQPPEYKDLSIALKVKTRLDTNEVKKFLPYFEELKKKEESFLENPDEINTQIWMGNLIKKYNDLYTIIEFSLE